jgi:hypothetical protein
MLLLTSTSDKIQLVTSAAGDVDVHATWVDNASGTITPGRTNTVAIATATTTDVVAAPAASTQRNVQSLLVRNTHASVTNTVTVRHTDGTNAADIFSTALAPGEVLQFLDGVGFQVLTSSGAVKTSQNQGSNAVNSGINVAVLAADVTNNNATANTIADVTGLSFPVTSGKKYWFRFVIQYTAAATTTGSRWGINGPGGTMRYRSEVSLTTTSVTTIEGSAAHDLPAASNASSAATGANIAVIEGFYEATANGNVIARFASEVASSAIVAKAGSVVYFQEVA